jgi:hypothetical protein
MRSSALGVLVLMGICVTIGCNDAPERGGDATTSSVTTADESVSSTSAAVPTSTADATTMATTDAVTTDAATTDAATTDEVTTSGVTPLCGDGNVDAGEACDDGVNDGGYGGCAADCQSLGPNCGDGVVQPEHEECDGVADTCASCEIFTPCDEQSWMFCEPTPESCPVDAQTNASVAGETPLGAFTGAFALLVHHYKADDHLVIVPAFSDGDLCEEGLQLRLVLPPSYDVLPAAFEVPAQLTSSAGDVLDTTAMVTINEDTWTGFFCDVTGHRLLALDLKSEGWSVQGQVDVGGCRSFYGTTGGS